MAIMKKVKYLLPLFSFLLVLSVKSVDAQLLAIKDSCQQASGLKELYAFPPVQEGGSESLREEITRLARRHLGIRYRSSGKNPRAGFDCSGFTGYIYKKLGIPLKASSPAQAMEGSKVPLPSARKGDLAFFGHKGRKGRYYVNHAAIVISEPGEPLAIIHSASRKGIVITRVNEDPYWKRSLLFVRSVL